MKKKELSKKTLAKVLKKISQTYQIRNINYYELLTIFFKLLYLSRRTNSCLNADIFEISYSDFKKLIHIFTNNLKYYFEEDIKYQKVLNIFLKQIGLISNTNTSEIIFKDLQIDTKETSKIYLLNQISDFIPKTNKINRYAIYSLKNFMINHKSNKIPIEIFLILVSNAQFIHFKNTAFFKEGTNVFKEYYLMEGLMCKILVFPIGTFNVFNAFLSVSTLNEIPSKNDTYFKTVMYNKDITFSLPYMIDFFGHKFWYNSFFLEKPSKDSFKFKLENFLI